ncbi:CshA/CshB family fibrillar adhesin-related protein [Demequina mangrovi]|uniref:Uncharacterized protein n=1 Tax=Demequina mangrovi TaxID=1043493 RepID=A0A1H6Y015_9MICO|nr:CshA/CshB family fibrillar adhesin-related protein [Demequina mangrovi]SEJ34648.1 hypothetical protein SAMN05421637_1499 [Demequina mangrovi]
MNRAIRLSRARAPRRRLPAAAVVTALTVVTVVPAVLTAPAAGAAVATDGDARFPSVQWITWGASGEDLVPDGSGRISTTETIEIGDEEIVVSCTIDDLVRTRGSDSVSGSGGRLIEAYASGTWRGDGLDELYHSGGTGTSNTLVAGLAAIHNANTVNFDFACDAALVTAAGTTPIELAGLVLASAESSVSASGFTENVGATISSAGTWRILDRTRGVDCTNDTYAQLTSAGGNQTLSLRGAADTTCESSTAGMAPNPMAVAFMDGVSAATDVTLEGRGKEAIALGVVIDVDFGDAPSTYGAAAALSQASFTGGEPEPYTSGTGQGIFTMTLAEQLAPTLRLGATVDFDGVAQPSADAAADDAKGSDDEDGVTLAAGYDVEPDGTFTVTDVACHATAADEGHVAGWIDLDGDGAFDASERSTVVECPAGGGMVDLTFTAPATAPGLATQETFARFRIAPTVAELTPEGFSSAGEVEDYAITMEWPATPGMSLTKSHTGGEVAVGDTLTFDLAFANTGNVPLNDVVVSDPTAVTAGCSWASVAAHSTVHCTASHVVTSADAARGYVLNTATAEADDEDSSPLTPVTSTVTVHAPASAADDADVTSVDIALTRGAAEGVLINDIGGDLEVTGHLPVSGGGALAIAADGGYAYTPAPGFSGIVSADYSIQDADGATDTATLTITVTPTADADSGTTPVDTPLRWSAADLLDGDRGSSLGVTSVTDPTRGTVALSSGDVVYAPAAGYSGPDAFTYTVTDSAGQTATATVSVDVTPVAVADSDATEAGTPITRAAAEGVLADDAGTGLTVSGSVALPPAQGTLAIATDGGYTYTPAAGFSGTASTTYTAVDASGQTATSTLTVTVTPVAGPDAGTTVAGTPLVLTQAQLIDDDEGSALEVVTATHGTHGTVVVDSAGAATYTPDAGFSGTDSFTYTVEDAAGQRVAATVTVTVTPSAVDDVAGTPASTPLSRGAGGGVLANDEGTALTVVGSTPIPADEGTLTLHADGSYDYVPPAAFSGTVVTTYTVEDGAGQRTSATLTIAVDVAAVDDADATTAGTALTRSALGGVLRNDLGTALTVVDHEALAAEAGTLAIASDGSYTFAPAAGFSGIVAADYTIEDAEGRRATATLTIDVTPVAADDADRTSAGTAVSRGADAGVLLNDSGTDLDVVAHDGLAVGVGELSIAADGAYTFVPAAGFSGTASAQYTVEDAAGQRTTAVLTVVVTPVAADDEAATESGVPVTFTVGDLTGDDEGTALRIVAVTDGAHGTVTIGADGSVTYTPDDGFFGEDSFTYTVEDHEGGTTTATVVVVVAAPAVAGVDGSADEADAADAATEGDPVDDVDEEPLLSATGADVASALAWMALLLGAGATALLAARRRTAA